MKFDEKANMQQIMQLHTQKADTDHLDHLTFQLKDFEEKIRHVVLFIVDLTNVLVPTKEAGKFTCNEDLNRSLKKREELQY